jgi:hypothetical protein
LTFPDVPEVAIELIPNVSSTKSLPQLFIAAGGRG